MASLRLTFPEKEEPSVIALTGARLTIGRLPFNTIQIIDRTVSGFHAELISEHGHYRLHDRGSSNGTFVNGEKVTDFHLTEACSITFGTVEAQFSPEAVPADEEAENFPTRSEINEVRKENAELKATVEALREETNALRLARPIESGEVALAVTKDEFDKVVVEREALKEERLKLDVELGRLKTDLAVLKRDRVNLQLAYDGLQREVTDLRAKAGGVEEIALPPRAAAAALAGQARSEEVRVEVPVRAVPPTPAAVAVPPPIPPVPAAAPALAPVNEEAAPAANPVRPTVSVKPVSPLKPAPSKPVVAAPIFTKVPPAPSPASPKTRTEPLKPFAPLPKAPALAATAMVKPVGSNFDTPVVTSRPTGAALPTPTATARPSDTATPTPAIPSKPGAPKAPIGLGGGLRPMGKPPGPLPEAKETGTEALSEAPTSRLIPRPAPAVKLPSQPAPQVGPKGTQKLA